MDAKIDTLWARYNQNDQTNSVHVLKLSFFYRVNEAYNFGAQSGISKGMFILVFLLHTGEKPSKCTLLNQNHQISFSKPPYG